MVWVADEVVLGVVEVVVLHHVMDIDAVVVHSVVHGVVVVVEVGETTRVVTEVAG